MQGVAFVIIAHAVKMLLHRASGRVGAGDFNRHRVLQIAVGQALDLGRERGGKQQRGPLLGQVAQNALQVRQKANVQHAVSFIQNHVFDLVQHGRLGFDVIQQTPWRGHQHLDTGFEFQRLRPHVHAAEDDCRAQIRVLGISLHGFGHLVGQLARGQ